MVLRYLICFVINYDVVFGSIIKNNTTFELSLIHVNDFHDRYEEVNSFSGICKTGDVCIGGFTRMYTAINELVKDRPNPIVLNAGDNFQGSFWYNIYKWNVTQYFFNMLPIDVYTLGNHEFDDGIDGIVPFLKALKAPTVVANIDDSEEPTIQGLYHKSTIIEKYGIKLGVIGVISARTNELSRTEKLRFLDEIESVNKEAERLVAEDNVDTIIVLSHCSYENDLRIAQHAGPKIGVIVGGHSHTFLYTGELLPGPDKPEGPYPTIINHQDGRQILVVQASANSKYLGNITVQYNKNGDVISWSGAPIYLNKSIHQDSHINRDVQLWKEQLDVQGKTIVGQTHVLLRQDNCRYEECNLGNFVTDAMVYSHLNADEENAWTYASIAITNSGGLRTSIRKGNITYSDIALSLPFHNTFDVIELKGKFLKEFLESAGGRPNKTSNFDINLMPVSGLRIVYNMTNPIGSRIQSLKVRCRVCPVPYYEDLELDKSYRIIVNSFLADGGDGHLVFKNNAMKLITGDVDIDVLVKYIKHRSPIITEIQNRILVVK